MSVRALSSISAPFCPGHGQLLCRHQILPPRTPARRRQPVLAARGEEAAAGSGAVRLARHRKKVTFLIPGQAPLHFVHVTQQCLERVLDRLGALGFETADGSCSQWLQDLPEGGAVRVVPAEPLTTTQAGYEKAARIKKLETFLRQLASAQNADVISIVPLPTAMLTPMHDEDSFMPDVAIVAGNTLYVGQMQRVISVISAPIMATKLAWIIFALYVEALPDLLAAIGGVTHVKMFVGGEELQANLSVQEMVDYAAKIDMSVLLPSGHGLGFAGSEAPGVLVPWKKGARR